MALDRRPLTPTPVFCHHEQARVHLLDRLMWSQLFEQFLQTKFPTAKRFGLEGCESLIPGLKHLIDSSAVNGVDSIVMGMPHRGRLNVLCNVVRKPLEAVFKEFSPPGTHPHAARTSSVVRWDWAWHLLLTGLAFRCSYLYTNFSHRLLCAYVSSGRPGSGVLRGLGRRQVPSRDVVQAAGAGDGQRDVHLALCQPVAPGGGQRGRLRLRPRQAPRLEEPAVGAWRCAARRRRLCRPGCRLRRLPPLGAA